VHKSRSLIIGNLILGWALCNGRGSCLEELCQISFNCCQMDQYEQSKFAQLAVAHKCSILLFTKDKFSNLGKKLRPEFEKLYLSSELKDCIKLLSTPSSDGGETRNAVDLVSR
jgi:hypothetical protein